MSDQVDPKPAGVEVLLVTGRLLRIQQERSAYVLKSFRFAIFLIVLSIVSVSLVILLSGSTLPILIKASGWMIGTVVVVAAIYFILYLFMNYAPKDRRTIIFSPILSLSSVLIATPITLAFIGEWVEPSDFKRVASVYCIGGIITAELGFTLFVYLVRDPLVRRFDQVALLRSPLSQKRIVIGSEAFPAEAICFVEARNQYLEINLNKTRCFVSGQLVQIERQMDTITVFRPHRSFLVFRHGISTVESGDNGQLIIRMKCGGSIPVARRRAAEFTDWFEGTLETA